MTKYCEVRGKYVNNDTLFRCPDDAKLRAEDCPKYTKLDEEENECSADECRSTQKLLEDGTC